MRWSGCSISSCSLSSGTLSIFGLGEVDMSTWCIAVLFFGALFVALLYETWIEKRRKREGMTMSKDWTRHYKDQSGPTKWR